MLSVIIICISVRHYRTSKGVRSNPSNPSSYAPVRIHSNARNSISLHTKPAKYKLHLSAQYSLTSETRHFDALTYSLYRRLHQSRSTAVIPGCARRKERLSRSEFRRRTSHGFDSAHVKYGGPKANKWWWWWWWWWWSSDYFRYEIFVFQATINPILEMANQKSELWGLKSEFRNQKSETRIRQKSEIANRNRWKSEIHNYATCDIQFWQSRFIPVCDVIISIIEWVKSSAFPLRGWAESF